MALLLIVKYYMNHSLRIRGLLCAWSVVNSVREGIGRSLIFKSLMKIYRTLLWWIYNWLLRWKWNWFYLRDSPVRRRWRLCFSISIVVSKFPFSLDFSVIVIVIVPIRVYLLLSLVTLSLSTTINWLFPCRSSWQRTHLIELKLSIFEIQLLLLSRR